MMMMKKKKKKKTTKKRVEFKDAHHSICETVLLAAHSVGIDVQRIEQLQQKETEDEPADEMVEDFWNGFVHHIVLFTPFLPVFF